jgi:hypothetical protein
MSIFEDKLFLQGKSFIEYHRKMFCRVKGLRIINPYKRPKASSMNHKGAKKLRKALP